MMLRATVFERPSAEAMSAMYRAAAVEWPVSRVTPPQ